MTEFLAVYGTIRQGDGNDVFVDGCPFVGMFWIPYFKMGSFGAFPVAIPSNDPNDQILTEIYKIHSLEPTDRLEGYPRFYNRKLVPFDGNRKAWIYYQSNPNVNHYIPSGDWFQD